jgi:peroxiredoxin Q/BCP
MQAYAGRRRLAVITVGEQAPDFTLESTKGEFRLSAFQGQKQVLILFYPKDNTPG